MREKRKNGSKKYQRILVVGISLGVVILFLFIRFHSQENIRFVKKERNDLIQVPNLENQMFFQNMPNFHILSDKQQEWILNLVGEWEITEWSIQKRGYGYSEAYTEESDVYIGNTINIQEDGTAVYLGQQCFAKDEISIEGIEVTLGSGYTVADANRLGEHILISFYSSSTDISRFIIAIGEDGQVYFQDEMSGGMCSMEKVSDECNLYGVWYIDKMALLSEDGSDPIIYDDLENGVLMPENDIGNELEYTPQFFRLGSTIYEAPIYKRVHGTLEDYSKEEQFKLTDIYKILEYEDIEISHQSTYDALSNVPFDQYRISFRASFYDGQDNNMSGMYCIFLNENAMLVKIQNKILLVHKDDSHSTGGQRLYSYEI